MIKIYKKNIKIRFISSKIMNLLSYHVSKEKIVKEGLILNNSIKRDVKNTLKLLNNIK